MSILDIERRGAGALWPGYGADAVTVCPYVRKRLPARLGSRLPIAGAYRQLSGGEVQSLMAGDRALWLSVAEQMARRGAVAGCGHGVQSGCAGRAASMPGGLFAAAGAATGRMPLPAFDEYGPRRAGWQTVALQYAAEPAAAVDGGGAARGSSG